MNVVIADDSKILSERLIEMLAEISGINIVGQAATGFEAIDLIEKHHPDAVLLDIRMPSGNGIDVLNTLKRIGCSPVIIMLTNFPLPQYRKLCRNAGADYFFDKSNDFEKVFDILKDMSHNY